MQRIELVCEKCGKAFIGSNQLRIILCEDCRKEYNHNLAVEYRKNHTSALCDKKRSKKTKEKSLTQIMKDLAEYNREHKTLLSYGKYVAMMGDKI